MTRTVKRLLLVVVLAVIGIAGTRTAAIAQATTYTCVIINGYKCYIIVDPCGRIISIRCNCGSTGTGTFITPRPIPFAGALNAVLTPVSVNVTLTDNLYGNITTTLDQTRTSPVTTIISNTTQRFPATGVIQFYANATLETKPGIVYTSRTPLTFTSTSLHSVDPFDNEVFNLKSDVDFYNANDPGQTTEFTLQARSTNVTLGSP